MEKLLTLEYGIAGLCVLVTLSILVKVGEFLWVHKKEKDVLSNVEIKKLTSAVEANTAASSHLENRLKNLEEKYSDLPKFKEDMRRFYAAIKVMAGEEWPTIRDEIIKEKEFSE